MKCIYCQNLFLLEKVNNFTLPCVLLILAQAAELTTIKAQSTITEKKVEALKKDSEGKI